jgi:hypothetical protein
MSRPCHHKTTVAGCVLCKSYDTDPTYRAIWDRLLTPPVTPAIVVKRVPLTPEQKAKRMNALALAHAQRRPCCNGKK